MFCYTYLSSLECGLRELTIWSEISSQHPIFFINVARCLNLQLTSDVISGLNKMNNSFTSINQEARQLLSMAGYQQNNPLGTYQLSQAAAQLMQQFLQCDNEFLAILRQLKTFGPDQPVWQILVSHIEHEQIYMYRLISNLMQQIFQGSPRPINMMPPEHP